ncbi:activity-dependent neuroprotector homeobox protein 2b [Genypterus blacodes]|uniref:activity-dependent neuroprotector homeobox protein 2b n=1 Tax=Genypterus blacodes TaxID=154954 RepID=UPI003F7683BC
MYQLPTGNIEKIRKARKAVKSILGELGLEDCQNYLKDHQENEEKNSDEDDAFEETKWVDITDGYSAKHRKKWPYRSQALCCSMCKYSSWNIYNFRSHVTRCHEYAQSICAMAPCPQCHFIAHPKVLKKHKLLFHSKLNAHVQSARDGTLPIHSGNERYQCRRCGFPSSSVFAMKKHVILKHLESLAEQYIGLRVYAHGPTTPKIYCCKICKVSTGTIDQMLHHMLVEPKHYSISTQVQSLIHENKNYIMKATTANGNSMYVTFPSIAPKPQQPQLFNSKSLVLPSNGQNTGTLLALQQLQGPTNSATLICAPGTNQAFLPPQASALVQLASAEAKGLLQPGATISLRSALPQGASMLQMSNLSLQQKSLTLTTSALPPVHAPPSQNQQTRQILFSPALQTSVAAAAPRPAPQPAILTQKAPVSQVALQGTMLTSQSLLSHLIPTGNKVDGMPTYTFAPLQLTMPSPLSTIPKTVQQISNPSQTKKWITCPLCNELFPSNVFDMHTEIVHKTKSAASKSESVAARASFLKKMPDKTVRCLTCKILLSEKNVFQHLLHGLNCLYCSASFFSIKQLFDHVKQHLRTAYCDFLRQKYRIHTDSVGGILFPYFDVTTTAPKELIGENEVSLVLVTNSVDLIYFKLHPSSQSDSCSPPAKINSTYCPFCDEKFQCEANHLQHLKQKHFVAPTIHAILKTEAFKCVYCNGVYTGKVTQQAVMLHIQRCRCSPKSSQPPKTASNEVLTSVRPQVLTSVRPQPQPPPQPQQLQSLQQLQQLPKPVQQTSQAPGLYFVQTISMKPRLAPVVVQPPPVAPVVVNSSETEAEMQCKKRLEAAWREVMETNKRERQEKAAQRKSREQEPPEPPPSEPTPNEPAVKLLLEPSASERSGNDERKEFITRYFNVNPYTSRAEGDELCKRLGLSKTELSAFFGSKRSKCLKSLKKSAAVVLLGFNMAELGKVKHSLVVTEHTPVEPTQAEPTPAELTPAEPTPAGHTEPTGNCEEPEAATKRDERMRQCKVAKV